MPRSRLHSIKGEFGTWQVVAVNRAKARKKLREFFKMQDHKEKRLRLKEISRERSTPIIPKGFF